MPKRSNLYTGRAGHLAVMAELLLRGWNTAIPEVDVGDDIFVVHDRNGDLRRVQVKTAVAKPQKYGYSAQFNLPLLQLQKQMIPDVTYVFAIRLQDCWDNFVVIDREALERYRADGMGSENRGRLVLRLRSEANSITCNGYPLSHTGMIGILAFPLSSTDIAVLNDLKACVHQPGLFYLCVIPAQAGIQS